MLSGQNLTQNTDRKKTKICEEGFRRKSLSISYQCLILFYSHILYADAFSRLALQCEEATFHFGAYEEKKIGLDSVARLC